MHTHTYIYIPVCGCVAVHCRESVRMKQSWALVTKYRCAPTYVLYIASDSILAHTQLES